MSKKTLESDGMNYVSIEFVCPICNYKNIESYINIPAAKTIDGGTSQNFTEMLCSNCLSCYGINIILSEHGETILDIDPDVEGLTILAYHSDIINTFSKTNQTSRIFIYEDSIENLEKLKEIANVTLEDELNFVILQMTFAQSLTTLESYLYKTISYNINSHAVFLKRFVASYQFPNNNQHKLSFNKIFEAQKWMQGIIDGLLQNQIYHRLDQVNKLYEAAFGFKLPEYSKIDDIIKLRHDIVHRNGETKDGEKINITPDELKSAIDSIEEFIKATEVKVQKAVKDLA